MSIRHRATVRIGLVSINLAETISRALEPDLDDKTQIVIEDSAITLNLEADTIAKLRALTNSHLRWIGTIMQLYSLFGI